MEDLFELLHKDPSINRLVIMPLTRLLFHHPFSISKYHFYPAGEFDVTSLRPIANKTFDAEIARGNLTLDGQTLREVTISSTGFNLDILENNPLVVFATQLNWDEFLSNTNHDYDVDLVKKFSSQVEKALDLIRFDFCRLDLPDTLPGQAGSWGGSNDYLGAMVYTPEDHESYLIAGSGVECSAVIKGIGLELDFPPTTEMPLPEEGEVASVASHGLSLLSEAMMATNETVKFMRLMTLLEFLASPDEYQSWKKLKGHIACHVAQTKTKYLKLCERFQALTSVENNGVQLGFRTLIVHQGKLLPDLIPDYKERKLLFRELQGYVMHCLADMIKNKEMEWEEYMKRRSALKAKLGVN